MQQYLYDNEVHRSVGYLRRRQRRADLDVCSHWEPMPAEARSSLKVRGPETTGALALPPRTFHLLAGVRRT
jgi:hypothetical protein